MQYNMLKSIIASRKTSVPLTTDHASFFVQRTRVSPYIEPGFSKIDFPNEKPSILLVSAIGASGKTTAAHALSYDTGLPVLDLAKHKAVGDNTLTGILTTAYSVDVIGAVLEGIQSGTHGVIVDGIDEGRSKTTEQAFEAFLDDVIQRSLGSAATTIVLFGRSQVVFNTWFYLADNGADVGMLQLDPFSLQQATQYIDSRVANAVTGHHDTYAEARDTVLARLSSAFSATTFQDKESKDPFLAFIGYPPVLDAVATLLRTEHNYHRVARELAVETTGQLETVLLIRIADYLLDRDYREKALPNFIDAIAKEAGGELGQYLRDTLYSREEQCARVLTRALDQEFPLRVVADDALNERYENAVGEWCGDHPFLDDGTVRNGVFAAVAIARCALSAVREYREIAFSYVTKHQPTYHLLHIFNELGRGHDVEARYFNMLIQACSEFLAIDADISVEMTGDSWEDRDGNCGTEVDLAIAIAFPERDQERAFDFCGTISTDAIPLGPYLINTTVTVPCVVDLAGTPAVEVLGTCNLSARGIRVSTPDLTVRDISRSEHGKERTQAELVIDAHRVDGHADRVSARTSMIEVRCVEHGLIFPLAKYVKKAVLPIKDMMLMEKYRRLRRIFSEFASHKKGRLGKYRRKIEHERVLRGELGRRLLNALLNERVLVMDTRFYYVDQNRFSEILGISWHQLRRYESSAGIETFLRRIS